MGAWEVLLYDIFVMMCMLHAPPPHRYIGHIVTPDTITRTNYQPVYF